MEIKRSPKANLENKKTISLLIGLVVALGVMFIAFEWSQSEITVYDETLAGDVAEEEELVEVTFRNETPPPPPPPKPETVMNDVIDIKENTEEVETVDFNTDDEEEVQIQAPIAAPEEDDEEEIHVIVEKMPDFPGGRKAMNRYLSRTIRYPLIAADNGIQGRVICQFVVNKDGRIVDIKVVRGVEASLDKEAVRVIKSMPKWTPGRQGGKNVRVKFTLPIRFKLGKR